MVASLLPSKYAVPSLNHHVNVVEGFACPVITGDMLCGSICPWSDLPRQTGSGWGFKSDPLHRIESPWFRPGARHGVGDWGWGSGGWALLPSNPKQLHASALQAVGISLGLSVKYNQRATAENLKKKPADINATLLETLVYMHKQFPLNALKADRTFQLVNGRICQKY